jgi:hypothetical protein
MGAAKRSSTSIGLSSTANLSKSLAGISHLEAAPQGMTTAASTRAYKFSLTVRGTVLKGLPPMYTMAIYNTRVRIEIPKNHQLSKNPLKTLYSLSPSFLALI